MSDTFVYVVYYRREDEGTFRSRPFTSRIAAEDFEDRKMQSGFDTYSRTEWENQHESNNQDVEEREDSTSAGW